MYPLSKQEIIEFRTLWNETHTENITEVQAEKKAQKLLSFISLMVTNPYKNV